ncbi:MAG TPA: T9SS type A sorting domain-containing protein, partial [Bacteroidia bacterium]|nr:T9SS type A sorting domain-containing protein [Bacteroidia bacterium]
VNLTNVAQLERRDTSMVLTSFQLPQYLGESGKDKNLLFTNDSVGYFLARHRNNQFKTLLVKTQNFGQSWTETVLDSVNPIISFCFPSANIGYLVKRNGVVMKSTDAGFSWNQLYAAATGTFNCIKFADNALGYMGGDNGVLLKTTDGGLSWQNDFSNTTGNIKDIYAFSGDVAYFVLSDNKIFKNQANYVGIKEVAEANAAMNIYPNPATDEITIDLSNLKENIRSLEIINVLGETVFQKHGPELSNENLVKVPVKDLSGGTYFVVVEGKSTSARTKLVILK